jgi:hypothetical protein
MSPSTLTPGQFRHCVTACAAVRLPERMPDDFREFLAGRAMRSRPALAAKIRAMTAADLAELYASLREYAARAALTGNPIGPVLTCDQCDTTFPAPAGSLPGRTVACPRCAAFVRVRPPARFRVRHLRLDDTWSALVVIFLLAAAVFAAVGIMMILAVRR